MGNCCFPLPTPPPRDGREDAPDVVRAFYSTLVEDEASSDERPSSGSIATTVPFSPNSLSRTPPTSPFSPNASAGSFNSVGSFNGSTGSFTFSSSNSSSTTSITRSLSSTSGLRQRVETKQTARSTATQPRRPFESKNLVQLARPRSETELAGDALTEEEAEYTWVKSMFDNSGGERFTVLKMERVHNPKLAKQYNAKRKDMEAAQAFDERWLFHGTNRSAVASIVENNFDLSLRGKHWNLFGNGIYFSPAASYSCFFSSFAQHTRATDYAFYTRHVIREGVPLQVLLCRVIVGKYVRGNQGMKNPPQGFHSAVDETDNPWTFVLFDQAQILPCYVITFVK